MELYQVSQAVPAIVEPTASQVGPLPRCWYVDEGGLVDKCRSVMSYIESDASNQCAGITDELFTQNMAKLFFGSEMERWNLMAQRFARLNLFTDESISTTDAELDWFYPYSLSKVASELSTNAMQHVASKLQQRCVCVTNDVDAPDWGGSYLGGWSQSSHWGSRSYRRYLRALAMGSPRICSTGSNLKLDHIPAPTLTDPLSTTTTTTSSAVQIPTPEDSKVQQCVFIVGVGRSATSFLVKYLNTNVPQCRIMGENNDFMRHLRHFTERHVQPLYGGSEEDALKFARAAFRTVYKRDEHECVGFKEILYGDTLDYAEFEADMRFLQNMCEETKIILHRPDNIDRALESQMRNWSGYTHANAVSRLNRQLTNFKRFWKENPSECYWSVMENTLADPSGLLAYITNRFA